MVTIDIIGMWSFKSHVTNFCLEFSYYIFSIDYKLNKSQAQNIYWYKGRVINKRKFTNCEQLIIKKIQRKNPVITKVIEVPY